jgi:hypothetical protein
LGRIMANSSPPYRATRPVEYLMALEIAWATSRKA